MKQIKLTKTETIPFDKLTEREKQIYEAGKDDARRYDGWFWISFIIALSFMAFYMGTKQPH